MTPSPRAAGLAIVGWCAVVLPWGVVFLQRVGSGATGELLRSEVLARIFEGTTHVEPPWYYGEVMVVAFLPWCIPMTAALVRLVTRWNDRSIPTARYAGGGLVAALVVLSISRGKLPTYVLPLAPLVAVLCTWELGEELAAPRERRLVPWLLVAALAAGAVVMVVAGALDLPAEARVSAWIGAASFGLGSVVAGFGAARFRPRSVYASAAVSAYAFLFGAALVLLPGLARQRSARPLIEAVPELASGRPIVRVEMQLPSLTFYLDRVPEMVWFDEIGARLDRGDAPLLVLDHRDIGAIPVDARRRLRELGAAGKYRVLDPIEPPRPSTAPPP